MSEVGGGVGPGWRLHEADGAGAGAVSPPDENLQVWARKFHVLWKGHENLQCWEDLGEGKPEGLYLVSHQPFICLVIGGSHLQFPVGKGC